MSSQLHELEMIVPLSGDPLAEYIDRFPIKKLDLPVNQVRMLNLKGIKTLSELISLYTNMVERNSEPELFNNIHTALQRISHIVVRIAPGLLRTPHCRIAQRDIVCATFNQWPLAAVRQLLLPIKELEISNRFKNSLLENDIVYVGDLLQLAPRDLFGYRSFGKKGLEEVVNNLKSLGFSFSVWIPDWPPDNLEELAAHHGLIRCLKTRIRNRKGDDQRYKRYLKTGLLIDLPKRVQMRLLNPIDDLNISVRAKSCLQQLDVRFIGELIQLQDEELLQEQKFGRVSLRSIHQILSELGLQLGLLIPGWSRELANGLHSKYKQDLEALKNRKILQKITGGTKTQTQLEDEFSGLLLPSRNKRQKAIAAMYFGFDGSEGCPLEEVGDHFGISRERVRQICEKFKIEWRKGKPYIPQLKRSIEIIAGKMPCSACEAEEHLITIGLCRDYVSARVIWNIAHGDKDGRYILPNGKGNTCKKIVALAKKTTEHWGLTNVADTHALLEEKISTPIPESFVTAIVDTREDFVWIDRTLGWFWVRSVTRNRVLNRIKKIFSITDSVPIEELRRGIQRDYRMQGISIPKVILLKFCEKLDEYAVKDNIVYRIVPIDWRADRGMTVDFKIAEILKKEGPAVTGNDLHKICMSQGITDAAFQRTIGYSPLIQRLSTGIYCTIGAKVPPGTIDDLQLPKQRGKVITDHGLTCDGKAWVSYSLSYSILQRGIFHLPPSLEKFVEGKYELYDTNRELLGTINVHNNNGWGLKPFFRRRGGDVKDTMVLVFNNLEAIAVILIGGLESSDVCRKEGFSFNDIWSIDSNG